MRQSRSALDAFLAGGHQLLSFSFRRDRYNVGVAADWPNVELGRSTERRLGARILLCLTSIQMIFRYRQQWRHATMVYARNLDLALLALIGRWITWCCAPLVYEVLDIHPILTQSTIGGKLLRWIERRILAGSQLLVVSSPAFVREYFQPRQAYKGKTLLLENRWSSESVFAERQVLDAPACGPDPVWTIGWFGNLRFAASLRILTAIADASRSGQNLHARLRHVAFERRPPASRK